VEGVRAANPITDRESMWTPAWTTSLEHCTWPATTFWKLIPKRCRADTPGGFTARIGDAEVLTLSVMQALLGHRSERRWLRYPRKHLLGMFPTLPGQSGYTKKLADPCAPTMRTPRRQRIPTAHRHGRDRLHSLSSDSPRGRTENHC